VGNNKITSLPSHGRLHVLLAATSWLFINSDLLHNNIAGAVVELGRDNELMIAVVGGCRQDVFVLPARRFVLQLAVQATQEFRDHLLGSRQRISEEQLHPQIYYIPTDYYSPWPTP
jgi:hypothetical protein